MLTDRQKGYMDRVFMISSDRGRENYQEKILLSEFRKKVEAGDNFGDSARSLVEEFENFYKKEEHVGSTERVQELYKDLKSQYK